MVWFYIYAAVGLTIWLFGVVAPLVPPMRGTPYDLGGVGEFVGFMLIVGMIWPITLVLLGFGGIIEALSWTAPHFKRACRPLTRLLAAAYGVRHAP